MLPPPLGPLPGPANSANPTTTLIGGENAAGLFPVIAPELIAAGSASGLFPDVSPSAAPSPAPGTVPQSSDPASGQAAPAVDVAAGVPRTSVLTAQVLGLIVLALAIMLTITRLFARGRGGTRGPGA